MPDGLDLPAQPAKPSAARAELRQPQQPGQRRAWHAGSANRTDGPRRAIHAFFLRPWVQPHWDFRASLSRRAARALTAKQRALLGFGVGPRRYDTWADDSYLGESPGVFARLRAILRRRLLAR